MKLKMLMFRNVPTFSARLSGSLCNRVSIAAGRYLSFLNIENHSFIVCQNNFLKSYGYGLVLLDHNSSVYTRRFSFQLQSYDSSLLVGIVNLSVRDIVIFTKMAKYQSFLLPQIHTAWS